MTSSQDVPLPHDPLAMKLSTADDRVLLSDWLPPNPRF